MSRLISLSILLLATSLASGALLAAQPLVDGGRAERSLGKFDVVVLDVRSKIDKGSKEDYENGHFPGALENSEQFTNATGDRTSTVRSDTGLGEYFCGLPTENGTDKAVFNLGALKEQVVLSLNIRLDRSSQIRFHRSLVYGVDWQRQDRGGSTLRGSALPGTVEGVAIVPQNDQVVANFEHNAWVKANQRDQSIQRSDLNFSGFKAWLGRSVDWDDYGRRTEADVYIRIIIDWQGVGSPASESRVLRAAYVISRVPATAIAAPAREFFYRFLPGGKPFRTLACISSGNPGYKVASSSGLSVTARASTILFVTSS